MSKFKATLHNLNAGNPNFSADTYEAEGSTFETAIKRAKKAASEKHALISAQITVERYNENKDTWEHFNTYGI